MIQLCNNNNVKLIFLGMPSIELEKRKEMNGVKALLENIDAEYIDFYELAEELQLNASEDFGDIIHLDVKGAKKVTSYIGKYLKGKGYVSDRRNDKEFSEWHKYYENSIYKEFYFDK